MTAAAVEPTEKAEIPFNKQPRDWRKAGVIVAFFRDSGRTARNLHLLAIRIHDRLLVLQDEVHRPAPIRRPPELHRRLHPSRHAFLPEAEPLLHGRRADPGGAGAVSVHHAGVQGPWRQRVQGHLLLPVSDQRHRGRLHLQVLLHPRIRVRHRAPMVRIPTRQPAILAEDQSVNNWSLVGRLWSGVTSART